MREVQAFADDENKLHKTRREAAVADFILTFRRIWWDRLKVEVDGHGRVTSTEVAERLTADSAAEVRVELIAALQRFEREVEP